MVIYQIITRELKPLGIAFFGAGGLFLAACQSTSTGDPNRLPNQLAVNARIKQNGENFSKLSSSQKSAVKKGIVSKGMKKEAVRLAWGKPDKIQQRSSSQGKKELWTFYRREEVILDSQSPNAMISRFYRSSDKYYDGSTNSALHTVQRVDRTVSFLNGRVVSWTRTRY